jgi:hypothetical protein
VAPNDALPHGDGGDHVVRVGCHLVDDHQGHGHLLDL